MLRRYLVKEIAAPFAAWTALLFVLFFVMAFLKGTDVLLGSAVTLGDFARFVAYLAPQFLVQAIPVAFLLAILLGLGRLSEDGELKAMQSVGLGPSTFFRGPLALGAALTVVMAALAFTLQPWGLIAVREAANDIIRRNLVSDIRSGVFHEEVLGFSLYVEQVEGNRWRHVLLFDERDPQTPLLAVAQRGGARESAADSLTFELFNGVVHRATRASDEYTTVAFEKADFRADLGEAFYLKNRFRWAKEELTPLELLESSREAQLRGESPRPFQSAFHWRVGQMLMPLAFAFFGTPLALLRRGGGRGRGFALTLAGYVVYYVLARTAVQLGEKADLPPFLAGHLANLVFIGLGLLLALAVERRGTA